METSNGIKNLVDFMETSIPAIEAAYRKQYQEGYNARIQGKKRSTHHARRRGLWFRGYDAADKKLNQ